MELSESIESINRQLVDLFGIESSTNEPMFRVVFSDEQLEKQLTKYVNGVELLFPEVREIRKYGWIKGRYVLERLVVVPEISMAELPCSKLSYECLWIFENQSGTIALPPRIDAAKMVIDVMYAALGKKSLAKYIDPDAANPVEAKKERLGRLYEDLFGNETPATDALAYGTGVTVPNNYGDVK